MNTKTETTATGDQDDCNGCNGPIHESHSKNSTPTPAPVAIQQASSNGPTLRRGKWTQEEEAYALAAIRDFNSGYLDAPPGSTLRTYLSEKLQCDPMRITKKFTGDASIGKKVFHPVARNDPKILKEIMDSQAKLDHLYHKWKQRLETQEQEMARKSMAAAAVSVASSFCGDPSLHLFSTAVSSPPHLLRGANFMRVPPEIAHAAGMNKINRPGGKAKNDITKAAAWLDHAEALLSKKTESNQANKEIEEEMKEISRLITEAPAILAISADLPKMIGNAYKVETNKILPAPIHKLHSCPDLRILSTESEMGQPEQTVSTPTAVKRKRSLSDDENATTDSPNNPMKLLASLSSQAAPVPIDASCNNPKALPNDNHNDAEDAKTFVNFLQSMVHVNKNV
mmetsp:Transcript_42277/g.72186  ORF Transcript_42277/g.72186 Transcript_42277/m.72186 type:complete len:397 (-) Transcript_42277:953-2143(-)|eukprot:CAMPEP_0183722392 /NCGR_PEP_ID=MMETSP0737-20130205/14357_1 /TAXON_ID=385413 /ORGANISM="Thalassiosira miniscula, Strain CCMP1093" /LENGTH=396 /DNA_ID=CAMNT_0025952541 /DNA_START=160 /DNA_END=1350 /DNA_ORIENTATION=+